MSPHSFIVVCVCWCGVTVLVNMKGIQLKGVSPHSWIVVCVCVCVHACVCVCVCVLREPVTVLVLTNREGILLRVLIICKIVSTSCF